MAPKVRQQGLVPYTKIELTILDNKLIDSGFLDHKAEEVRPKPAAKPPTTFLSLPGEIRNKIYDLISAQCTVEIISWTTHLTPPARCAQVSREIRQEYLPIYHRHRRIHLTLPRGARRVSSETRNWLSVFGASRLPLAETISIYSNRASCVLHFRDRKFEVEAMLFRLVKAQGGGFVMSAKFQRAVEEVIELLAQFREDGSPYMTGGLLGEVVDVLARSGGKLSSLEYTARS